MNLSLQIRSVVHEQAQAMHLLLRLLKTLFGWLLALLILFEEWGWEPYMKFAIQ